MKIIKKILALMPSVLISLLLSFFVWFSAVNSNDPTEEIAYAIPIPIEVLGQNPQYTITEQSANNVLVTIKAPRSVHNTLKNDMQLIRATINISELKAGQAELAPEITIDVKPTKLVDYNPKTVRLFVEKLVSHNFEIALNQTGNLPMGVEAGETKLDTTEVNVSGAESKVNKVVEVLATIEMSTVTTDLTKQVDLQAVDAQGNSVEGVTLSPSRVTVTIPVTQKGGYKNAFLVLNPLGSPAYGFRIAGTEVIPQFVTIYAKKPSLTPNLPDLIQTQAINLNGRDESFEEVVSLNLPDGVELVGDVEVRVKVIIEPVISTKSIREIPVTVTNVPQGLKAVLSISKVDVYLTGPSHLLADLNAQTLTIGMDLDQIRPGTHQIKPVVVLPNDEISYLIVPEAIEVYIQPE